MYHKYKTCMLFCKEICLEFAYFWTGNIGFRLIGLGTLDLGLIGLGM